MPAAFWTAYALKLAVLSGGLVTAYALAHRLKRLRFFTRRAARYVRVVETTVLAPQVAVHLLAVGSRYVLVGGGNAGLTKLAELVPGGGELVEPSSDVEVAELRELVPGLLHEVDLAVQA